MVDLVAYFFFLGYYYANGTNFSFEMKLVRHYFGSIPKRYASFDIFFLIPGSEIIQEQPFFIYLRVQYPTILSLQKKINEFYKKERRENIQ